jgi:hypothetical protein
MPELISELVMDQRVVWDKTQMREVEEAKQVFLGYRQQGYEIVTLEGSLLERFKWDLEEFIVHAKKVAKKVLKILCEKGDERLVWDSDNGREAMEAKKKFTEFIGKGFKAYSVDTDGKKNRRIEEFDVDAGEILMIPPTAKG